MGDQENASIRGAQISCLSHGNFWHMAPRLFVTDNRREVCVLLPGHLTSRPLPAGRAGSESTFADTQTSPFSSCCFSRVQFCVCNGQIAWLDGLGHVCILPVRQMFRQISCAFVPCSRYTECCIERGSALLVSDVGLYPAPLLLTDNKFSPTRLSAGRSQKQRKWTT